MWLLSGILACATLIPPVDKNYYVDSYAEFVLDRNGTYAYACTASFPPAKTFLSTIISFVIPGCVIVIANISIIRIGQRVCRNDRKRWTDTPLFKQQLWWSGRKKKGSRELRFTRTCTLLSTTYLLCWIPFSILHCLR